MSIQATTDHKYFDNESKEDLQFETMMKQSVALLRIWDAKDQETDEVCLKFPPVPSICLPTNLCVASVTFVIIA